MSNPAMQRAFLKAGGTKPSTKKPKDNRPRKKQALKSVSDKQAARNVFLVGVKAERLRQQQANPKISFGISSPPFYCEKDCGVYFDTYGAAWENLTLHHTQKRSKGRGYKGPRDFGVDDPKLLVLVCSPCHRGEHGGPEWSVT